MWQRTRKHVLMYQIITLLMITSKVSSNSPKRKALPFPAHIENYEDTLIWVIKVTGFNVSENELDIQNLLGSDGNRDDWQKFVFESEQEHLGKMDTGTDSAVIAREVASDLNLLYLGKVAYFKYLFMVGYKLDLERFHAKNKNDIHFTELHQIHKRSLVRSMFGEIGQEVEGALDGNDHVVFYSRQRIISRQKRSLYFSDPFYSRQWHLHNYKTVHMDINVTGLWERNINGTGVTVAVVDDGLEWNNEDLYDNYNPSGSWDLNSDDSDPMPNGNTASNHHGTRCAGEIAAVPNKVCSVGVAYGAKVSDLYFVSGIRVLDGPMTDSLEAAAFTKYFQVNDIYSCRYAAMQYGINFGRNGYGSIYVVASGNGGRYGDNCNYDGYANSIFTVTIVTEEAIAGYDLFIMEYVQLAVTITHPNRGMLEISLKCPSGTRSLIGATRSHDNSSAGFSDWTFSTVRCWGESPVGVWGITIKDIDTNMNNYNGYLKSWKLKIYGTPMTPEQFQQRMRLINRAMSGEFLNDSHTPPCAPPPVIAKPDEPMSQRTLKC
ncbi:hypothetical protein KUTeg_006388 [Tegillarca granosa]|uniref:P/Homo B domain-containing protein n=1 Tax=Tegillarca granosa TaxID=220873 RepID=A0ABQ9FGD4_TEGGR|nr:hypothetical protein KUTeg_006388 [Tegillarca granosa]